MATAKLTARAANILRAAIVYDGINIDGGHITARIGRALVRRGYLTKAPPGHRECPVWVLTDAGRSAIAAAAAGEE